MKYQCPNCGHEGTDTKTLTDTKNDCEFEVEVCEKCEKLIDSCDWVDE